MSLYAYWGANFMFDVLKTSIPCVTTIICLSIFNMGYKNCWSTILFYPIGMVPFCYALSFMFQEEGSAQGFMLFGNVVSGSIIPMVVYVLRLITSTAKNGDAFGKAFKIVPNYLISSSVIYDASKEQFNMTRTALVKNDPDLDRVTLEPYDILNIGGDLLAILLHCIIGFAIVMMCESQCQCKINCCKKKRKEADLRKLPDGFEMDEDVIAEEMRVEALPSSKCLVKVQGLRKVYKTGFRKTKVAIEKTSFAIDRGECFALLGVNGAGKTTTFKSLTKDVVPTNGVLTVMGYDIHSEFELARKYIGYCPQFDTIYDLMTVEEHIQFQMVIKGIPFKDRDRVMKKALENLSLTEYKHVNAGTLSGGNKRKLSVAMALIGNPPVILLDEPSAGMDPEARRFMWGVVAKVSQQQKHSGVIITTHSMEEAEALSTKMGIQVQGGIFRCFGSSQHIKNKFATGYEIEAKFKTLSDEEILALRDLLQINQEDESIELVKFIQLLEKQGVDRLIINEIASDGYGNELLNQQNQNKCIHINQALQWLQTESFGFEFLKLLSKTFDQVEVLEHVADFFKVRVPRGETTIGYAFGRIEDRKQALRISEYSVSQTTLEQIFQTFAKITVMDSVNKIKLKQEVDEETQKVTTMMYKIKGEVQDLPTSVIDTAWVGVLSSKLGGIL